MKRIPALLVAAALAAGEAGLPTARAFAQSVGQASAGARVAPALGPAVSVIPSGAGQPGVAPLALDAALGSPLPVPLLLSPVGGSAGNARLGGAGPTATSGPKSDGRLALPGSLAAGIPGARGLAIAAGGGLAPGAKGASMADVHGERAPPGPALTQEDAGAGAASALSDRARQDARFDGAAHLDSPSPAERERGGVRAIGQLVSRPFVLGSGTLSFGRAAVPSQGRQLPPAPGSRPPSVAPSSSEPAAATPFHRAFAETVPLAVLMAVHALGLVFSMAALATGLGWAAAGGAAIVGGGIAYQWKRLPAPESAPLALPDGHRAALVGAVAEILDAHLSKLGRAPELRPRIVVSNDHGPYNAETGMSEAAVAQGKGLGPDSTITVGEGLLFRTREHVSGMLAHELGHLALGHDTPLSRLRGGFAMNLGLSVYRKIAYWGWGFHGAAWLAQSQDLNWGVVAVAVAAALAWTLAGFGVLYAAFLAGLSTYRREELQADRFAAHLDGAQGWASALQHSVDVRGEVEGGWWNRLHALHPTYAERIRRLLARR